MRIFSISILFIFVNWFSMYGQICIEGNIYTQTDKGLKEAVPFVSVVLRNAQDSSKLDFATMTDVKGKYFFENVAMQEYLLEVSCIGYDSVHEWIEVAYPEVGNSLIFDFDLHLDSKQLSEVVVTANAVNKGLVKSTYLITPSDIKLARFSMDLLEKIPSLSIDPVSQKIKNAKGSLKILINGISASEIDLKATPANKILRIDYYDVSPARYAGFGAVVDVITKNLENGYTFGATIQHAFTTGFFNDDLFFKYNNGKHQISADYSVNYRNYSKVNTAINYDYLSNNTKINRTENSTNPFGYTDNYVNIKYMYQELDKYIFQAKFSTNILLQDARDNSEIEILENDSLFGRKGASSNISKTFNPSLDIYFWKLLKNKQSITFDLIGNLFTSNQTIKKREYGIDNNLAINDKMNLDNVKKSYIGEIVYEKLFNKDKINIGNKIETYSMNSNVQNSFDNTNYISSFLSNYIYGEYTGIVKNFIYQASLGLSYRKSQNASIKYSSIIFRPLILIGYKISNNSNIRFVFTQVPEEPSISEQSDNIIFITDNILNKGNPLLKNSLNRILGLNYGFANKYLDVNILTAIAEIKNKISTNYVKKENYYLLTFLNNNKFETYGVSYSFGIKPFGNNLITLKLNGETTKYFVKNDIIGYLSHWYTPLAYNVLAKWNNWTVSHQGAIVSYDLNGTYLRSDENNMHFSIQYKNDHFSVFSSLLFAFMPSHYLTKTIPESTVQYQRNRKIFDNQNMFTLGFSYTFNSGKKYEEQEKKIENKDTDSGLFK